MKISTFIFGVACLANGALGAADFSNISSRQLWPFSSLVEVKFTAANVERVEKLILTVSEGDKELGTVPVSAYRETSGIIAANGEHILKFDPTAVPALSLRGNVRDLRVSIDTSSSAVEASTVLYQIFDLTRQAGTAGAREFITEEALRSGAWGAWEETIWTTNSVTVKTPVWTGVTNDTKYALTHLVMRRIDAGKFNFGYAESADVGKDPSRNYKQREITITKPYYIGVYEFTAKQVRLLSGSTNQNNPMFPSVNDSFDQIRGEYTTAEGLYDWPTDKNVDPNSYIGKLRARTGVNFDLPTEAQWEKAARAGSDGVYYDGCLETHKYERNQIAWNRSNTAEAWDDNMHRVGLLKPNNYGLYDTLGNAWEWVLDWQAGGGFDLQTTDPEGPKAAGASYWSASGKPKRVLRGASYPNYYDRLTLHERTQNPVNEGNYNYGWRVVMPVE